MCLAGSRYGFGEVLHLFGGVGKDGSSVVVPLAEKFHHLVGVAHACMEVLQCLVETYDLGIKVITRCGAQHKQHVTQCGARFGCIRHTLCQCLNQGRAFLDTQPRIADGRAALRKSGGQIFDVARSVLGTSSQHVDVYLSLLGARAHLVHDTGKRLDGCL